MKLIEAFATNATAAKKYIENLLSKKQDKLTFDTTPTENSTNAITSGAVNAYINNIRKDMFRAKKVKIVNPTPELQRPDFNIIEHGVYGIDNSLDDVEYYYSPGLAILPYINEDCVLPGYEPGTSIYGDKNPFFLGLAEGDTAIIEFTPATKVYKIGEKVDCTHDGIPHFYRRLTLSEHIEELSQSAIEYMKSIKITNLTGTFRKDYNCNVNHLDMTGWDTSECVSFSNTFESNDGISKIDGLESLNTSKVTDMSGMFQYTTLSFDKLDLSKWDASSCKDFSYFLAYCQSVIDTLDVSGWGVHPADANTNKMMLYASINNIIIGGVYFNLNGDPGISDTAKIYVPQALIDRYKADTNWAKYKNQFYTIEKIITFANASGWTMTVKNVVDNTVLTAASDGKYYLAQNIGSIIVSGTNGTNTIADHTIDVSTMKMAEELSIDITTLK